MLPVSKAVYSWWRDPDEKINTDCMTQYFIYGARSARLWQEYKHVLVRQILRLESASEAYHQEYMCFLLDRWPLKIVEVLHNNVPFPFVRILANGCNILSKG